MEKEYKMSQARKDELEQELNYLKTTRSDEVAEQIKIARGFGDLSENSEYDEVSFSRSSSLNPSSSAVEITPSDSRLNRFSSISLRLMRITTPPRLLSSRMRLSSSQNFSDAEPVPESRAIYSRFNRSI